MKQYFFAEGLRKLSNARVIKLFLRFGVLNRS